jgi:ferric-chelate reductase
MLAEKGQAEKAGVSVILSGPYGSCSLAQPGNFIAVASGTGITMALLVVLQRIRDYGGQGGVVQLVWVIRRMQDVEWITPEMALL